LTKATSDATGRARGRPHTLEEPMPHEQVARNQEIVELHTNAPYISYGRLAQIYGITRQRVQQIVASAKRKEELYGKR